MVRGVVRRGGGGKGVVFTSALRAVLDEPGRLGQYPRVRLENTTGGSSKFWEAVVSGNQATIRFGKIGTSGQTQVKTYGSEAEAKAAIGKVAQKKLGDGYVEDGYAANAGGATAVSGVTMGASGSASASAKKTHAVADLMVASKLPLSERKTFAYYLNRIIDTFDAFQKVVDAHKDPAADDKFGFVKEIKPEVKKDIAARHDAVVGLLQGQYAHSRVPTETNSPGEAVMAEMGAWLKELLAWQGEIKMGPLALGFDSTQSQLADAIKYALEALPKVPKAELTQLDAGKFAKLGESDAFAVFADPEKFGYQSDVLDDAIAAKLVKKLIGPERTKELLDQVKAAAEQDVEYDDDGKAGKATISSVEVIRSGGEVVGYKVTAHCNAQPSDNDLLVDWMLDAKGRLMAEDTR